MYGWTNSTAADAQGVVWKRFLGPSPGHRHAVERALLVSLAGRFPVPTLVAERDPFELGTQLVPGRSGLEAWTTGVDAATVYRDLGRVLERLHSIDPATVDAPLDGDGPAVLHGDYGAHNVVVGDDGRVAAVVDWERARRGEPVEDLAWSEWIAGVMFPVPREAIVALYDGYGERFSAADRKRGLERACAAFERRCAADRWPPGAEWFVAPLARTFTFPDL